MRVKSRRFPTIEKDMKMVLAHCGSLFLDPALLMQVSSAAYQHKSKKSIVLHDQLFQAFMRFVRQA